MDFDRAHDRYVMDDRYPADMTDQFNKEVDNIHHDTELMNDLFHTKASLELKDLTKELMFAYDRGDGVTGWKHFTKLMDTAIEEEANARL